VVFLQDFHDYFRAEEAPYWRRFLNRFGDRYRVLAPMRRGYGASDDSHWGFDVATQADDIVRFLDALGIQKAVLVGRVPATQEMTWLAEHHPERLAGLVFIERPMLLDVRDAEVREFQEAFWRGACDLGDRAVDITGPRAGWAPHFLSDTTRRIAVPAALLTFPPMANMNAILLTMVPTMAGQPSCAAGVQDYYKALAADSVRLARVQAKVAAADRTAALTEAMARAFGANLRTISYTFTPGNSGDMPEPWYQHTRAFVDELSAKTAWR
jgi:pimeloyl-ACP methyl ester carboxylesterase